MRIGVDIVEVRRIKEIIERFGPRFLYRVFTAEEIDSCQGRANSCQSFSAKFAAKEAIAKALGTGISQGVRWKDVIVLRDEGSRPVVRLHGTARSLAPGAPHLSISHTTELAIAVCIFQDDSASDER